VTQDRRRSGIREQELAEYRAFRQEMTAIDQEYSRARLENWSREMEDMAAAWQAFQADWQGTLDYLANAATSKFAEIAARGVAAGTQITQSWRQALLDLTGEVDAWGENLMQTLDRVGRGFKSALGGGGRADNDWLSWLGLGFEFGGLFHQGGVVEAHRGMVVSPESLLEEERLIRVQTGEGILPRETMVRLGEDNFEALRTGRFQVEGKQGPPRFDITIQVQSLDAAGVASLDWDRVVERHLLPALEREVGRRW
jgi:hypothetical protein